jgi:guanosine-3',5'-bis(diphosphate) 3'-pyrophosphohydrolase
VASHWLYKEDEKTLTELQHKTHSWLQSLLELQSTSGDSSEFLEHVKIDLFPGEVYAFTPKGKIFAMPGAPRWSILPTRCTPTWATAAWPGASTVS